MSGTATSVKKRKCVVIIEAETEEQAETVLRERLFHEEDYGFEYRILGFSVEDEVEE